METNEHGFRGRGARAQIGTGLRKLTIPQFHMEQRATAGSFEGLPEGVVRPGELLATAKSAAPYMGFSPRLMHMLDLLFKFSQAQDWTRGSLGPIVWPSLDAQMTALGIGRTQAKAINRALADAGLVVMRESSNRRRYGYRDAGGRIVEAYGFDLSPLAIRFEEFRHAAAAGRAEHSRIRKLKKRSVIARNAMRQIVDAARDWHASLGTRAAAAAAAIADLAVELATRWDALRATGGSEAMQEAVLGLERLADAARAHLDSMINLEESDPPGPEYRPHTTTTSPPSNRISDTVDASRTCSSAYPQPSAPPEEPHIPEPEDPRDQIAISPAELVTLAPRLGEFLLEDRPTWRDLAAAAPYLRHELGISKAAWDKAVQLLGRFDAVIALAIVSTKPPDHFEKSAGGYFGGMMKKAEKGQLDLRRTIFGLRHQHQAAAGTARRAREAGRGS